MAEFVDVISGLRRMCSSHINSCEGCDFETKRACKTIIRCVNIEEAKEIEETVMDWTKQHPEPKYPTWREWLIRQGLVDFKPYWSPSIPTGNSTITCLSSKALEHIPADIAQKLSIEPKEETYDKN